MVYICTSYVAVHGDYLDAVSGPSNSGGNGASAFGPLDPADTINTVAGAAAAGGGEWTDQDPSTSATYPWHPPADPGASYVPYPTTSQGALNLRKKRSSSHLPSPPDNKAKKSPDLSHTSQSDPRGSGASAEGDWQAVDLSSTAPPLQPPPAPPAQLAVDFESDIDVLTLESPTRAMSDPFPGLRQDHHHHHDAQEDLPEPFHEIPGGHHQGAEEAMDDRDDAPDDSDVEVLSVVPPRYT